MAVQDYLLDHVCVQFASLVYCFLDLYPVCQLVSLNLVFYLTMIVHKQLVRSLLTILKLEQNAYGNLFGCVLDVSLSLPSSSSWKHIPSLLSNSVTGKILFLFTGLHGPWSKLDLWLPWLVSSLLSRIPFEEDSIRKSSQPGLTLVQTNMSDPGHSL